MDIAAKADIAAKTCTKLIYFFQDDIHKSACIEYILKNDADLHDAYIDE